LPDLSAKTTARLERVREFLTRELPSILSGDAPDPMGVRRAVFARVLAVAMKDVQEDFEAKSQGNRGKDGVTWEPLAVYTVRKRAEAERGQSGRPGGKKAEGFRPPPDVGWLRAQRREIYNQEYRRLRMAGVPAREAARQASVVAKFVTNRVWKLTGEAAGRGSEGRPGGSVPGDFPILNDTGALLLSASAGRVNGAGLSASYSPPEGQQVVYGRGFVAVDSTVPYGDKHMTDGEGETTGGFRPARPWKYGEKIPAEWLARWTEAASSALAEVLAEVLPRL